MQMISEQRAVNTGAPTEIVRFFAGDLLNVMIRATGDVRIGMSSVSATHGFALSSGEAVGYNRFDFPIPDGDYEVVLYAATAVNTSVDVSGFFVR